MYKNCKTTIRTRNKEEVKIKIFRGVKQGDLLSPLLFNLCLEPLLEAIDENTDGISINEMNKIPALVFADDIVLLDKNKMEAQQQLLKYLNNLGMNISVEKSLTFQVVTKKDTWFLQDPEIKIKTNNSTMPSRKTYLNTWELKWVLHRCSRNSEYYKKNEETIF
jgi:hypothetical protein